jgi:hypothetical protein
MVGRYQYYFKCQVHGLVRLTILALKDKNSLLSDVAKFISLINFYGISIIGRYLILQQYWVNHLVYSKSEHIMVNPLTGLC